MTDDNQFDIDSIVEDVAGHSDVLDGPIESEQGNEVETTDDIAPTNPDEEKQAIPDNEDLVDNPEQPGEETESSPDPEATDSKDKVDDGLIGDWDDGLETINTNTDENQFKDIATELGFEGVENKDQLLSQVKAIQEENSRLSEANPFANEELKKANELANNGHDYTEFLLADHHKKFHADAVKQVQADLETVGTLSDKDLVKAMYESQSNGNLTTGEISDSIENLDETQLKLRAMEARNFFKNKAADKISGHNNQISEIDGRLSNLKSSAEKATKQFNERVSGAINSLTSVEGFKISESKRFKLTETATSPPVSISVPGKLAEVLFKPDGKGGVDVNDLAKKVALLTYGEAMLKHKFNSGISKGKKEEYDSISRLADNSTPHSMKNSGHVDTETDSDVDEIFQQTMDAYEGK